jgi:hydroxyacylglutathione hydrolase
MKIHVLQVLSDNYSYIVEDGETILIIDPGEAAPVIAFLDKHRLKPQWIVNTHKHFDHIDGNNELNEKYDCKIAAPDENPEPRNVTLQNGDVFKVGALALNIHLTKGHTKGHVILHEPNHHVLFSGDTLFAMGCGRLFEGTPADMFATMQVIKSFAPETKIYCGHEYSLSNAKFAAHLMPDNHAIQTRYKTFKKMDCTMPTTLAEELKTNPFLMAETVKEFAEYRRLKDSF